MTVYPVGYGRELVTMDELRRRHEPRMHPEYARRLFAYLEAKDGLLGIGGGWRSTQPAKPGFAPEGKSFHQDQRFASGFVGYAAVDLVARNGGSVHRAPTWDECADAPQWFLHTFITGEPWHMQCIEMRGWQTWVNGGRKDPIAGVRLPSDPLPPPPDPVQPLPGGSDVFQPIQPFRNSDTRPFGAPMKAGQQLEFALGQQVPTNAVAVALTATVADARGAGWLTVWPPQGSAPNTSCVNFDTGKPGNGSIVVGVKNGKFRLQLGGADAHILVDVTGYWTADG